MIQNVHTIHDYIIWHLKITGSVAESSKALVLGTSLLGGVGSNPTAARLLFSAYLLVVIYMDIVLPCMSNMILNFGYMFNHVCLSIWFIQVHISLLYNIHHLTYPLNNFVCVHKYCACQSRIHYLHNCFQKSTGRKMIHVNPKILSFKCVCVCVVFRWSDHCFEDMVLSSNNVFFC